MNNWFNKESWKRYKYHVITIWVLFILAWLSFYGLFYAIGKGALGPLPTFEQLENPKTALATEIYTADSVLLGKWYSENRSPVTFDELSPNLVHALVATEDVRFYKHSGIDPRGLARAIWGVLTLNLQGGASTISQQLSKLLFHDRLHASLKEKIVQKLKEQIIAVRLESRYTKEEILQMYLNTAEFSDNAFGIKAASKTYFNKLPSELDMEEASVLIGMLKAPYAYNPRIHPERSRKRRNVVINQMYKYGYIDRPTYDANAGNPDCKIVLDFKKNDHGEGLAPYFREFLRLEMKKWAQLPENQKLDGGTYDIYRDGLTIYTTINSKLQALAEAAVAKHMAELQKQFFEHWKNQNIWAGHKDELNQLIKHTELYGILKDQGMSKDSIMLVMNTPKPMTIFSYSGPIDTIMSPIDSLKYHRMILQTGFIVVDPKNGNILAWVGGTDFEYFKFDHITSRRQIGSTFKPFVYATAVENGYSPCFRITDLPVTFEGVGSDGKQTWTPENDDGIYTGKRLTLKEGLAKSVNTCAAYLIKEVTPVEVVKLAKRLGITSHIDPYPAICLGTPDISAFDMAGAYTAFANKGIYTKPNYYTRIEDKTGNILSSVVPVGIEVFKEEKAYVMIDLLRYVVDHGTGSRLRTRFKLTADLAGKTGTTQNQSDGWFMGLTPELVGAVWTGGEDRFVRFRSIALGQGATMALPIWGNFLQSIYADSLYMQTTRFEPPKEPMTIELDCSQYEDPENPEDTQGPQTYGDEFNR